MSSGFGINSKPKANSSAYVNSPYWDKKGEKSPDLKTFEGSGNTINEAFQNVNSQMVELSKTTTIVFIDLKKYGNYEHGFKMVMTYKTK